MQLPAHERERLLADLEPLTLQDGQVLCEAGARQSHVYFPTGATLSLMSFTSAGETCELMAIGREGLAGADVVLAPSTACTGWWCSVAGRPGGCAPRRCAPPCPTARHCANVC